jgi:predicted ArsR family transcriptional regulator
VSTTKKTGTRRTAERSPTVEEHERHLLRVLRKRDAKDAHQIAAELGVTYQALAHALANLVADGRARRVHLKGRRFVYTKP